jgi:hypothetical protein
MGRDQHLWYWTGVLQPRRRFSLPVTNVQLHAASKLPAVMTLVTDRQMAVGYSDVLQIFIIRNLWLLREERGEFVNWRHPDPTPSKIRTQELQSHSLIITQLKGEESLHVWLTTEQADGTSWLTSSRQTARHSGLIIPSPSSEGSVFKFPTKHWSSVHHLNAVMITPWCKIVLERMKFPQLVKTCPAFRETVIFITVFTEALMGTESRAAVSSPHF